MFTELSAELSMLATELQAEIECGNHSTELTEKFSRLLDLAKAMVSVVYLVRRSEDAGDIEKFIAGMESLRQEICLALG